MNRTNLTRSKLDEKPPSKTIVDISTTHISPDDIKSEHRVGFWNRFTQPILYPAGGTICDRCGAVIMDIQI